MPKVQGVEDGFIYRENNAAPVWRDASSGKHYDVPDVLKCLKLEEKLLIERLSVAVTIHHLAHGGVESACHVATFPKPAEPMAAVRPRLPCDVTIARVRRGATARAAAKKNGLYTVRASKAIDAFRWLKTHNPYYSDVTIDHSRMGSIPEGAEIPGVQDWEPGGPPPLPEDNGHAPGQTKSGRDAGDAAYETGGMLLPDVAPDFRDKVRNLLATAHDQIDRGKKHVDFQWPRIEPGPASEFKPEVSTACHFRGYPREEMGAFRRSPVR